MKGRPLTASAQHAPTPFQVSGNELLVGDVPISRLAARVGRTPFYAYDRGLLSQRVSELRAALPAEVRLHYAMKANPMPAVVQHMVRLVDGIDVASGGELKIALDAGADPMEISFAGPGKSADELVQAVAAGILINVESPRELPILSDASARLGVPARVAVRVNPDFEIKGSRMRMGGGSKQFGVDVEQVASVLEEIGARRLEFEGFHLFAGSQNLDARSICEAQRRAVELAIRLAESAPNTVKSLNLGGGFGIPYFPGEQPLDLQAAGEGMQAVVAEARRAFPEAKLIIELGRYLVGEAGVYVCRIVDRKVSRGRVFLVTDGGLHHQLAASGNFGQVIRRNYPVAIGTRMGAPDLETVSVVGPLCTPLDLLAEQMPLPAAGPGDLVVVFQSGAYGYSASPRDFLSHPHPPEVLV